MRIAASSSCSRISATLTPSGATETATASGPRPASSPVYLCGVSDILEPKSAWRDHKRKLTGRKWDYDFRRLFYTWSEDITSGKFHDWVEVSSREETGGNIFPADLYVAPSGEIFVLWTERALDERLREKFFPGEKQRHSLEYAILRDGKVTRRVALVEGGEGLGDERPGWGRFHESEDGRLFVFHYVGGRNMEGRSISENRIVEIHADGSHGEPTAIKLEKPLSSFFTATVRAGCRPSNLIDVFGDIGGTMRYVRIRLTAPPAGKAQGATAAHGLNPARAR